MKTLPRRNPKKMSGGGLIKLYHEEPRLLRDIIDMLSLADMGRLSQVNRTICLFIWKNYEWSNYPICGDRETIEQIIMYRSYDLDEKDVVWSHQKIREWNPFFGKALVYHYINLNKIRSAWSMGPRSIKKAEFF